MSRMLTEILKVEGGIQHSARKNWYERDLMGQDIAFGYSGTVCVYYRAKRTAKQSMIVVT